LQSEYVWVVEPIDGTASSIIGQPLWGTLIALLHEGEPVLGLLDGYPACQWPRALWRSRSRYMY
jgi:fructose-1,6-bisphosphatase/inositol monophosphatase family enzyme